MLAARRLERGRSLPMPSPAPSAARSAPAEILGRYVLSKPIGAGGMASVHLARWVGAAGLSRVVAVKRLHPNFAADPEFAAMFLDEARIATRIRHVNVIPTLDVASQDGAVFLVMEYVPGESLAYLQRIARKLGGRLPVPVAVGVLVGVLRGLHAAHEARADDGTPLEIVHRDVSPHNVLVGLDGIARLLDFGIAKALGRLHTTRTDQLKGKMGYIAPEQLRRGEVDRRTDVFTASVVLWEALVGRRLFEAETDAEAVYRILEEVVEAPSKLVPGVRADLDAVVLRGLERDPAKRFATALEMATALEAAQPAASASQIGGWLATVAHDRLEEREAAVREIEAVAFSSALRARAARVPAGAPSQLGERPALGGAGPSAEGETKTLRLRSLGVPEHAVGSKAPAVAGASASLVPPPRRPLALFGPAPSTLLGAAAYAVRVWRHRGGLARDLTETRAALAAAQEARRDELVRLVDALPAELEPGDPREAWLAPLERFRAAPADPSLQPFELQWAADVNDSLAAIAPRRAAAEQALREYAELHERFVAEQTRAEARQKRAEIELRAAHAAARAGGRPAAELGALEVERVARTEELERLRAEVASAESAVRGAELRRDAVEAEAAELESQRKRLEDRGAAHLAELRGFREGERRVAFVRAGEQILDWCPGSVPESARASIAAVDAALMQARERLDELERAHAGFDRGAHRRGVAVLGVLAGVLAMVVSGVVLVTVAGR
jgi:serine/threonine-protein kinase